MNGQFDNSAVYEAMDFSISAIPGIAPVPQEFVFESEDHGILALSAGWTRQNILASYANKKIREWAFDAAPDPVFPRDRNYRAYEDERNKGYDPHQMVLAESEDEAEWIRGQIDAEYGAMQLIQSHWLGTLGEFGGAVLRPELMIGGVGAAGRGVGGLVVREMLLEAGSEAMLQADQRTRTALETSINVVGAGVITGILGKAIDTATQLRTVAPPQRTVEGDPDYLGVTQEYDAAGAQRATQEPEDARLAPVFGSQSLAYLLAWGPSKRLTRSKSPTVTEANEKLASPSMYTVGMVKGQTRGMSVEDKKIQMQGELLTVFDRMEEMGRKTDLGPAEFAEEVGRALSNNDRHIIPEVQEAAILARAEVLDTRLEAALEIGHKIEPKPGQSYFPRIFSRENVIENFDGLKNDLTNHYTQVYKGDIKGVTQAADTAGREAYRASNNMIVKMERLVKMLSKTTARGRTAREIIELDKARKQLKLARAQNAKMLGKQPLRTQIKVAEKRLADLTKPITEAQKAARVKLKARIAKAQKLFSARPKAVTKVQKATHAKRKAELDALKKAHADMTKPLTDAQKAIPARLRAEIKAMKVAQAADVKGKAADIVRTDTRVSGDVVRDAERAATDTIHNMMGGLPHTHGISGIPTHLRQRNLEMTDQMLDPYLEKNAITVLSNYTNSMDPYTLMKQEFGDSSMADMFDAVGREYKDLIAKAKTTREKKTLQKNHARDVKDLMAIRDRLLNQVQRGVEPGSGLAQALQFVKLYNVSTQLGGITLSSFPDIARPLMTTSLRSFSNGIGTSMRHLVHSFGEPNTMGATAQVRRTGAAAQRTLNSRMSDLIELGDAPNTKGRLGKFMTGLQKHWGTYTGFNHWTDSVETLAAHSSMDFVLRVGKELELAPGGHFASKKFRSERMRISQMGFTEHDVIEFWKHASGTSGGGTIDPILKFADTLEWNNPELARLFEAGIGGDVRRTIVRITAGDKPRGMDNAYASLIFQYTSFMMAATNKMMVAGLQQRDASAMLGMLASMFLGSVVDNAKGWLRGEDAREWSDSKNLLGGIDRSGMIGIYNIPFNLALQTWGDTPTRYLHRGFEGILGGSTISQVGRAAKIWGDVATGEFDEDTGEHAQRLIPLWSNALHLRQLAQRMSEN